MADFSNAQVGDVVRVITYFRVIECEVVKVTPTQIHTASGKYRRKDGSAIGSARGLRIMKDGERA